MNLAQALIAEMGGGFRLVTSAISATSSISVPAGGAVGDLLVLLDMAINATSTIPTASTPSGFTSINNVSGTDTAVAIGMRQILFYKLAASDLSGTSLTCMSFTGSGRKVLLVFRGTTAFASATVYGAGGQLTNGNPTLQTLAINGVTAPLVALSAFSFGSSNTMSGSTSVPATAGASSTEVKYRIYTTDPTADLDADTGDGGDLNTLQSCYIQLTY